MGTVSTFFYSRARSTLTALDIATAGNTIFDAIEGSGMIKVSNDIIPGQCNRLVVAATEDPLDVVVTAKTQNTSVQQSYGVGYKVFRHPQLNYYLKVSVLETGSTFNRSCVLARFQYAQDIDVYGGFLNPITLNPKNDNWGGTWDNNYGGIRTGVSLTLRVSCSSDHFVFCITSDSMGYEAIQYPADIIAAKTGISTSNIAIFKLSDAYNIVFLPRDMNANGSYIQEVRNVNLNINSMGLQRKWLINTVDGTWVYMGAGQSVSAATELGVVSDKYGVRVAQLFTTVEGERLPIPVGCVHAGAVGDMDIVTVNLDGNGDRQYFASYGFGTTNWLPGVTPIEKIPVMLLPWGD